ncbi:MAG: hypothetical protein H6705_19945 [Myxococcales bacterium]|nr:hypothetical protein [Myxococcales bacterium]
MTERKRPELPATATMADFQRYVHDLEAFHGWLDVDLVHNCFLMGEEVGELFKAVRKRIKLFDEAAKGQARQGPADDWPVAEELVDVFNYLLAIANRLDIDVEAAFRRKNEANLDRTWG